MTTQTVDPDRSKKYLLSKGWTLKDGFWSTPPSWDEDTKKDLDKPKKVVIR